MSFINIIPIASGSTGNSIYIEIGKYKLIIDMGIGYRKIRDVLLMHDRNIEDIDAVFLTHGHSDHVKGAKAIGNHINCRVYCDSSVMYPIRDIKAERVVINLNEEFSPLEGLKVKSFSIPHDYVKTCGYSFIYDNHKVSYLTDCGKMSKDILKQLEGSDVVVLESNHDIEMLKNGPYPIELQNRIMSKYGHLSNDDCAETIAYLYNKGTKNFILAHLSEKNNTPELALKTSLDKMKGTDVYIYACKAENDDLLSF